MIEHEQLWDESPFIQPSGEHYTHTCCGCGSSHNIKLVVINGEEIEVTYYANDKATTESREKGTFDILFPLQLFKEVVDLMVAGKRKKARKFAGDVVLAMLFSAAKVQQLAIDAETPSPPVEEPKKKKKAPKKVAKQISPPKLNMF